MSEEFIEGLFAIMEATVDCILICMYVTLFKDAGRPDLQERACAIAARKGCNCDDCSSSGGS